jgi:hypothetical protein
MPHTDPDLRPMPEQITYANILFYGAWLGIFLMVVTYALYVLGIVTPHVDPATVAANWKLGVQDYLHVTNSPHGWGWVALLGEGDFLNFVGMVLLAVLTIVCYLVLLPGYIRRKDWSYCTIVILEVLVLTLAASGLLGGGGH